MSPRERRGGQRSSPSTCFEAQARRRGTAKSTRSWDRGWRRRRFEGRREKCSEVQAHHHAVGLVLVARPNGDPVTLAYRAPRNLRPSSDSRLGHCALPHAGCRRVEIARLSVCQPLPDHCPYSHPGASDRVAFRPIRERPLRAATATGAGCFAAQPTLLRLATSSCNGDVAFRSKGFRVLSNAAEFEREWAGSFQGRGAPLAVDFQRSVVIAAHLGERPNCGAWIDART